MYKERVISFVSHPRAHDGQDTKVILVQMANRRPGKLGSFSYLSAKKNYSYALYLMLNVWLIDPLA
jgi:hypothetical protein